MIELTEILNNISESELPYAILFWGSGCGPCAKIKPAFEKWAYANRDRYNNLILNVNANHKIAGHFKVMAVPTLVTVDKNMTVKRMVGPRTEEDLNKFTGI